MAVAAVRGLQGSTSVMMKMMKNLWQATEAAVENGICVRVGIV